MDPPVIIHAPVLTPQGVLALGVAGEPLELEPRQAARLQQAFERGSGHGLLCLGADEVGTVLPAVLSYWRDLGCRYVTALCALPNLTGSRTKSQISPPAQAEVQKMVAAVPPMTGAEYLTAEVLAQLWRSTDAAFDSELAASQLSVEDFLKARHPAWNLVGRVHFHLAENRRDDEAPFAFLATYTTGLSAQGKAQHLPLAKALQEYSGARNHERLLSLLTPVQRAAERCPWLRLMVDAGEVYHPLRWGPQQALQLLKDTTALETSGVIVRMPASWRMNRPARPHVKATVGGRPPSALGMDALLDFKMEVTLDGEILSQAEMKALLAQSEGLAFIRGKWVEVDHDRLKRTLAQFESIEQRAATEGLTFGEAMRMLAGAGITSEDPARTETDWSATVAGGWLADTLAALGSDGRLSKFDPGHAFQGELRPYQRSGAQWLYAIARLRLGSCLADDMGLGKTIQVLALLLALKGETPGTAGPSLLVAPASLLANWAAEIERFAPSLKIVIAHPSATAATKLKLDGSDYLAGNDLVITSYGFLTRAAWLQTAPWRLGILDEAQAIKNPSAKQTQAVKKLRAEARIALTGTPIENRLGDLWSIFDFINPGLLGSAREFSTFAKSLADRPHNPYGPLRELVRPYILRRLKTDKSIIADLPAKTEVNVFCPLSRKQAALYQQAVKELARQIEDAEGIQRRGVVLASLMRFKQICNHPSQWLGDHSWAEADSGKFARLRDIAEVMAARQEKALVFTQFQETTAPLAAFLGGIFGRPGLILHGGTEVKRRKDLVRQFQEDESVPFFVLSVKAGGAGLNLTAASHVVHFDRWWNPAVENQATDRAFRIGQNKNVLVHKFICRGTVEDKIDRLIESKKQLAGDLLSAGGEMLLTEMKDEELLKLVALDLSAAMKEGDA
jgi:non-specific serine/threonine protein kinase